MIRADFNDKIILYFRHQIPLLSTVVLLLICFLPINSPEFNYFRPNIGMICIFYWAFKRDYLFSYFSAFLVGFLMDVYSSVPLGCNILIALLIVFMTRRMIRFFQSAPFGLCWALFAIIWLWGVIIKWLMLSAYFESFLSLNEIVINYCATVLCYPFVASVNVWIQNKFLPQERINE